MATDGDRAVADTRWFREWMHGVDPIPVKVLEELAAVACLCTPEELAAELAEQLGLHR